MNKKASNYISNIETEEQIKFECSDAFKINIVYPLLATEIQRIGCLAPLSFLDLGVGSGQIAKFLLQTNIKRAILLDKNEKIIQSAVKNFNKSGIKTKAIVASATEDIPIPNNSVDLIIALFLLNQVDSPQSVFENANRLLKKGGRFILAVPHESYLKLCSSQRTDRLSEPITKISARQHLKYNFGGVNLQSDLYVRPNSDYSNTLIKVGFKVIEDKDLFDTIDESIGNTPKAYWITSQKI